MAVSKRQARRNDAIVSGVLNAVDTVVCDKAMTAGEAYAKLKLFIESALSDVDLNDIATPTELRLAKSMWPLACEDVDPLEAVKGNS